MKSIVLVIIIIFGLSIYFQYSKIEHLTIQVSTLRDTIEALKILNTGNSNFTFLDRETSDKIKEPFYFRPNDSIIEIHRIIFKYGKRSHLIKVELFKNDSLQLTYKLVSLRNLILGHGNDSLLKTKIQILDKTILTKFKNMFANISNYELTYRDGMSDCIGPELLWEALIGFQNYEHSEICSRFSSFTDACKFLMRQVKDKELEDLLKHIDNQRIEK